ncbi:hypothetical protein AHF37_12027 [Paragonimus kellicotti]|nr:hypothetical protein AHF37_12027 [Paragonimus kellicotti]
MTTTDQFRLKAREMLQSALECGTIPSGAYESEFLAIRIESAIFDIFNSTDSKYKQRVRTRVMNLRDSNNPNLRLNVLMGHVNPEKLASMTSEVSDCKLIVSRVCRLLPNYPRTFGVVEVKADKFVSFVPIVPRCCLPKTCLTFCSKRVRHPSA